MGKEAAASGRGPDCQKRMSEQKHELVLVIDFGAQYAQLIARRVRECGVYCEILPYTATLERIKAKEPAAIILSGGPASVYVENAPKVDAGVFQLGVPVLGICYGHQFTAQTLGGTVSSANTHEYGKTSIVLQTNCKLFRGLEENNICWMSHTDFVSKVPEGFTPVASTSDCPIAAMINEDKKFYTVQFHPEVEHTPFGRKLFRNFLFDICELSGDWNMKSFVERKVAEIKGPLRRCRFLRRGRAGTQGGRQTADLHLRGSRPAAQRRRRPGGEGV